jgi:preprotein translocase subunit YajC
MGKKFKRKNEEKGETMINIAYAMAQQQPSGSQQAASPISSLLPLILIFAVFYFLLIRPQKKQQQQQQNMINNLKKGDRIVTSGGIHGKITALKGKEIEVEIASNTRITLNKQSISQLISGEEIESSEEPK